MFGRTLVMYIYAETPIHAGSGATLGAVDLPIQRERHTEFPIIQGSSLKGVLRNAPKCAKKNSVIALSDECENCPDKEGNEVCPLCGQIFGTEEGIGGISVTDAKILAFPVRTLKGVFGWITCPLVLDRYKRDLNVAKISVDWEIPEPTSDEEAKVCKNSYVTDKHVYIEDLQLKCCEDGNVNKIAKNIVEALPNNNAYKELREKLQKDLIVVSNNVFRDLVSLTTEVVTRIRIDPEKGTVKTGALWTEEYLPADTIMYSLILIPNRTKEIDLENLRKDLKEKLKNKKEFSEQIETIFKENYSEKIIHIGGDETIGKGFASIKLVEGGNNHAKKS